MCIKEMYNEQRFKKKYRDKWNRIMCIKIETYVIFICVKTQNNTLVAVKDKKGNLCIPSQYLKKN